MTDHDATAPDDPARFERLGELFEAALALPAPERSAFLATACEGDARMRADVERLLAEDAERDASFTNLIAEVADLALEEADQLRAAEQTQPEQPGSP